MFRKHSNPQDTRVVVAMSGGVDSSTSAALLVEQGYEVIGVMARLWTEDDGCEGGTNRCCTPEQMADARRVASRLDIPFYAVDFRAEFKARVVDPFVTAYLQGITPNPCLNCNRHIRFGRLLATARDMNAAYLATGHYARVRQAENGTLQLLKGVDPQKDQSYVLSVLTQDQLARVMFPVGDYTKQEVRAVAARHGLPVASKHDSQDLCFVASGDYRDFLARQAPQAMQPGPVVNRQGDRLGTHTGLPNYTIGQRKGLGISYREPLYVIGSNPHTNTLLVGTREELGRNELRARAINWVSGNAPPSPVRVTAKIRYRAKPAPATVAPTGLDSAVVHFDESLRDITPGQGVVFYQNDVCLGGGIIAQ